MSNKSIINIPQKCDGCVYGDICPDYGQTCEYYHSNKYEQQLVYCEYRDDITERTEAYNDIIKDFED